MDVYLSLRQSKKKVAIDPAVTIEANSFTTTGGTFDDNMNETEHYGVSATETAINFVNTGDWCIYEFQLSETGIYQISYEISTPSDNAEISIEYEGETVSVDAVTNNDSWGDFQDLIADEFITFETTGTQTIKIIASGTENWQWNLQSISFTKVSDLPTSTSLLPFDNSNKVQFNTISKLLSIEGIEGDYSLQVYTLGGTEVLSSKKSGNTYLDLADFDSGIYVVKVSAGVESYSQKIVL